MFSHYCILKNIVYEPRISCYVAPFFCGCFVLLVPNVDDFFLWSGVQQQTSWLDQLGRHCPHFGIDSEVSFHLILNSGQGLRIELLCTYRSGPSILFYAF